MVTWRDVKRFFALSRNGTTIYCSKLDLQGSLYLYQCTVDIHVDLPLHFTDGAMDKTLKDIVKQVDEAQNFDAKGDYKVSKFY
jgi:hypothetical protein